jgi:C_GCAxxG_C_C family probable redox protein
MLLLRWFGRENDIRRVQVTEVTEVKAVVVEQARVRARELFNTQRANCAESVFNAVRELVASDLPEEVVSLMTPLGGGIAIRGANCGAMVAGVVALGLVYGRKNPGKGALEEHRGQLWETYALYNQLPQRFQERFGTIDCWDLTAPRIYGSKACRAYCEEIVAETAGMAMQLLFEAKEKGLTFEFKKSLLSQAAEAAELTVGELLEYKRQGKPFPIRES